MTISALRAAACVAVLALTLAGCGDEPQEAAPPPASPSALPGAPDPAATSTSEATAQLTTGPASEPATAPPTTGMSPATVEVDPASTTFFTSPSGNLACSLARTGAVCEIDEHAFPEPAQPADCDLDHGTMLAVEPDGPARFLCHGDTAFVDGAVVIPYGGRISNGAFVCSSSEAGMSCSTAEGDHGFHLSRASYRLR